MASRYQSIMNRTAKLRLTPPDLLPYGKDLKYFIRDLQKDIKEEAAALIEFKDYQLAGTLLTDAIEMKCYLVTCGYSCVSTLDKNLHILRAECGREVGHPDRSLEDCRQALEIDENSERAKVEQVLAQYTLVVEELQRSHNLDCLVGFECILADYPSKVLEHSKVLEVIASINRFLDPHTRYDRVRKRPTPGDSQHASGSPANQNGDAVAEDWLPAHVKATKKQNKKAKATAKSKKKNRSKQLVTETSDKENSSDESSSVIDSDASSITPRRPQSKSHNPPNQTGSAAKPSSYGLDDFGPIQMPPASSSKNGAIPKAVSNGPKKEAVSNGPKKEAASTPAVNGASADLSPAEVSDLPEYIDSLYCKLCKVKSNAYKQLVQHLTGSKHIAKHAEYMKSQGSSLSTGSAAGGKPGAAAPPSAQPGQPGVQHANPGATQPGPVSVQRGPKGTQQATVGARTGLLGPNPQAQGVPRGPPGVQRLHPGTQPPVHRAPAESVQHRPPGAYPGMQYAPAQSQKYSVPTHNPYATLSPQADPNRSTKMPVPAAAAPAPRAMTNRLLQTPSDRPKAVGIGPLPGISQETLRWLNKFTFRLACEKCFLKIAGKFGYQGQRYQPNGNHLCYGGWLVCLLRSVSTPRQEIWGRIRSRTKPDFNGPYTLCEQFNSSIPCKIDQDSCWYCHSPEEMTIWDAERAGIFNRKEVVKQLRYHQGVGVSKPREDAKQGQGAFRVVSHHQNGSRGRGPPLRPETGLSASKMAPIVIPDARRAVLPEQPKKQHPINDGFRKWHMMLMSKVGGHFLFLCGRCFDGAPQFLALQSPEGPFCSNSSVRHPWENPALIHILNHGGRTRYLKVRPKPKGIPAGAILCLQLQRQFGCTYGDLCKFAHNGVEIEVWKVEALYSLPRETIVQLCSESFTPSSAPQPNRTTANAQAAAPQRVAPPAPKPAVSKAVPKFAYGIMYVCGLCFTRDNKCIGQNTRKPEYCANGTSHLWKHKTVVVHSDAKKKWVSVKPRHPKLKKVVQPKLCPRLEKCNYPWCMFPHFFEEARLWEYMAMYNLKTLDEVMEICLRQAAASSNGKMVSNGSAPPGPPASSSLAPAGPPPDPRASLMVQHYYCSYCDQHFQHMWRLEQHTQTIGHRSKVNSDKERQWKHRSPPLNVLNGQYQECQFHKNKRCYFSNAPEDKNNCTQAHNPEELEEWRERHQYRMMKMKKAKEQKLYAFMDEVLEEYNYSTNEMSVITEELPGITVECSEDLNKFLQTDRKSDSTFTSSWKFDIKSKKQQILKRVGLLYDEYRLHFYLSHPKGEDKPQVCPGNLVKEGDVQTYHIEVLFHSRMLGSFSQWVLFDFGSKPVLVRKLEVHVGSEKHFETFKKIQQKKQIPTWDSLNSEIVKFQDDFQLSKEEAAFNEKLLATYKPPASLSIDDIELGRLDRDNYKLYMHKMLHLEERERTKRIARYSIETTLNVTSIIEVAGRGLQCAVEGLMYATVNLKQALMDDSEASQIIMRSVQKMLLKFDVTTNKVYEASILYDQEFGSENQDMISLKLGSDCVTECSLTDGTSREVQIQFQLDRLPFCKQHNAVDKLHNMDMVFPPKDKPQRFPYIHDPKYLTETNFRQERAAKFICSHGGSDAHPLPGVGPVLVYGPFGTGKTYTLAMAVKRIVSRFPRSRVLICTQSNSAADWYITEQLHKFVEQTWNQHQINMLRIYAPNRNINTIDPIVFPYVFTDEDHRIAFPDSQTIRKYQIILTTLAMSSRLLLADLQGHFTHILIDEAGQALETEALQPLTLATGNTCVVLAGDHIQMSPKIFSDTARAAKFNKSLLERLFGRNVASVFLTFNYRTCEEILNFIAETYYHEKLSARGNHPPHPDFYPLTFCAVKGEDQHVGMSYMNYHEVLEIVFRVEELCHKWPEKWGKLNKNSIGVIAPYSMQVRQIRTEMRRRGLGEIVVETVEKVQGKQFRALFISTVRTRRTLQKSHVTVTGSSSQQDEEFYYGFLSDHKLLTTALTRAQSLVIVAGDPVTLCSEGQCSTTWLAYLKECEKHNSLMATTMEEVYQEVQVAKQRLNPFAKTFKPSRDQSSPPRNDSFQGNHTQTRNEPGLIQMSKIQNAWKKTAAEAAGAAVASGKTAAAPELGRQISEEFPALTKPSTSYDMPGNPYSPQDENVSSSDEDDDVDLQDALLRELQRQVREDRGELEVTEQEEISDPEAAASSGNDIDLEMSQEDVGQLIKEEERIGRDATVVNHVADQTASKLNRAGKMNSSRKMRNVRMIDKGGHLFLIEDSYDRSRLEGADTFDDYDSDDDLEEDELDRNVLQEHLDHVENDPDKFKICSFHFDLSGHTYALPKDGDSSLKILITSKRKRGKALNLDEVIVEILEDTDELENLSETPAEKKTYGKVLCIMKRGVNPYLKKIVCTIDKYTDNLMVPIDRTFPKIFAYTRKEGDTARKAKAKQKKTKPSEMSTVSIFNLCRTSDQGFQFQRNVEVSLRDRPNKLFVVQYLKWHAKTPYPVGIITEELAPGDTKVNALHILKLVHGVREKWKSAIQDEISNAFPEDWEIPEEDIKSRYDARSRVVFTIDPPDSEDLDDALSVDMVDDGYFIGIHIADVSYFVKKGSALDNEAKERATSFYPSFAKPINMLPPVLSNKLCSLLPEEDKLAISVFVTLDENGSVVGDVRIVRSVIRSHIQLTYEDAENIIKMTASEETEGNSNATIEEKILTLSKLAKERRRLRLGDGRFAFSHDAEEEEAQHPLASSLVEEMMLLANEAVARFLIMKYPTCTPLRRQLPPSEEEVGKWFERHDKDVPNSVELGSRLLNLEIDEDLASSVHVLKETWDKLRSVVSDDEQNNMTKIADIVCSDENHPQLGVARANFFKIQERSTYICSEDHPDETARRHHSLRMPFYTHFTSPIRRFIDLVVHRLLTCALDESSGEDTMRQPEPPYTAAEMAEICHHCTNQAINCKGFEKKTRAFQLALKLKEAPQPTLAFVENASDTAIRLMFPYRKFIASRDHNVPLRLLKPIQKPVVDEGISTELMWKHRVYDVNHTPSPPHVNHAEVLALDIDRFTVQVSASHWQEILTGIKTEDIYQIQNAVMVATDDQNRRDQDIQASRKQKFDRELPNNIQVEELTCERSDNKTSLFINFKRDFSRGGVVQVQLHGCIHTGVLTPRIQLFGLTPKLSLCTEHRQDAITSFAEVATLRPTGLKNISTYKKVWLPIIEMLTAYNAVQSDETIIIHGVQIRWERTYDEAKNSYAYTGLFAVQQEFCEKRHIKFTYINKKEVTDDSESHLDYFCIRYTDLSVTHATQLRLRQLDCKPRTKRPTSNVHPGKMTFVAHAASFDVTKDKGMIMVQVTLTQTSSPFPSVLLATDKVPTCTLELIPKTEPDRRLEKAVRKLDSDKVSPLIRDICLLQKPRANQDDSFSRLLPALAQKIRTLEIPDSPFAKPNASQTDGLRQALEQPFTVIQGPPGTGKTITGAHLAYFFTKMNKGLPPSGKGPPQVLYCGPSNKSVDVITEYLKHLQVKVVRVYSETIERKDFPIPGEPGTTRKTGKSREANMTPGLRVISLHHLIRRRENSNSRNILKWEETFRGAGYETKAAHVKGYKQAISKAEEEELKKYQIILCTCNASGSKRIRDYTNIVQTIIDEAGMCNEPETLIPLVSTNPCQVVLIGDHKQLRPIIQEKTAQLLGMETSLLEKYEKKAQMLTMQYRMHVSICAFPSNAFYGGKLETADIVKQRPSNPLVDEIWPGGPAYPVAFCHLYGKEETLTVKTAEGNEQSKANLQEVKHVVRIAKALIQRQVNPENIVILSQYRLQCAEIEDALQKQGQKGVDVRTVITSQGSEWDYVIMSTVRSLPRIEIEEKASVGWKQRNLGFIIDENQMNVAVTRARRGFVIVGNQHLLQIHDKWSNLIESYRNFGAVVDARSFARPRY